MSDLDIENLAEKIIEKLSEKKHVCLQPKEVVEDITTVSKAMREAKAEYSDVLSTILIGKGINGWHNKSINFIGLLILLALGFITMKLSGLWGLIVGTIMRK